MAPGQPRRDSGFEAPVPAAAAVRAADWLTVGLKMENRTAAQVLRILAARLGWAIGAGDPAVVRRPGVGHAAAISRWARTHPVVTSNSDSRCTGLP